MVFCCCTCFFWGEWTFKSWMLEKLKKKRIQLCERSNSKTVGFQTWRVLNGHFGVVLKIKFKIEFSHDETPKEWQFARKQFCLVSMLKFIYVLKSWLEPEPQTKVIDEFLYIASVISNRGHLLLVFQWFHMLSASMMSHEMTPWLGGQDTIKVI